MMDHTDVWPTNSCSSWIHAIIVFNYLFYVSTSQSSKHLKFYGESPTVHNRNKRLRKRFGKHSHHSHSFHFPKQTKANYREKIQLPPTGKKVPVTAEFISYKY